MKNNNTIAAIATPNINCAISIIRISGHKSYEIIEKLTNKKIEKKGGRFSREFIYENNEIIDDVIVLRFVSPYSFTGEDLIEINCHGGILITNKILNLIIENGARLAEPGEFTKRAFLNNKLTLRQANSINNLIFSKTENSLKLASNGIVNKNNFFFKEIKEQLFDLIAKIEVNIDYPEYDDIEIITKNSFLDLCKNILEKINKTIKDYQKISYLYNGLKVVIIGKPNVGKSSLLNTILKKEKAIVTNIKGTTRDIISESIVINGVLFNFFDTAGIRKTKNIVEQMGIKKTIENTKDADLILFLIESNKKISNDEKKLLDEFKKENKRLILVKNKSDLNIDLNPELNGVKISCTKNNIKQLEKKISSCFLENDFDIATNLDICSENELNYVKEIKIILENAINKCLNDIPLDLLVEDITIVYKKICTILGDISDFDLIDKMFKNFCLGK